MKRITLNSQNMPVNFNNRHITLFMNMGFILILQLDGINTEPGITEKGYLEISNIDWNTSSVGLFNDNLNSTNIALQKFIMEYNSKPLKVISTALENHQIIFNCDLDIDNNIIKCIINIGYTGLVNCVLKD